MSKNKVLFVLIIFIYFFIPIIILFNKNLYQYKFVILTFLAILIYIIFRCNKVTNKELGITKDKLFSSIQHNLPICLMASLIIMVSLLKIAKYKPDESLLFYLFYIFISCPIQEFLYRGVFGYFEHSLISNKYIVIIVSSVCYSFVHIIYRDLLTCLLTFIIGIIWYLLYRRDDNLLGVSLSHIVLGILTISLGIIN